MFMKLIEFQFVNQERGNYCCNCGGGNRANRRLDEWDAIQ